MGHPVNPGMDAALPVDVREIERGSVHTEPRRTRHVRLGLADGPTLRVYDPRALVTPDVVGSERTVELAAVVATVDPADEQRARVTVGPGEQPVFQGLVVAFEDDCGEALLDVGDGTVRFDTVTVDRRIHVGDYVRVTDAVVHVEGISPPGQDDDAFLGQLAEGDPDARREAARYLGHQGSADAVDPLVECYRQSSDPGVREAVVDALGRVALAARGPGNPPNARVRSTLEAATGDESRAVRETADQWLERVRSEW